MALQASSDLVIGQYVNSPRLRAMIDAFVEQVGDQAFPAIERIKLMRRIETAEGIWLDQIGKLLGIMRPSTTDPSMDLRFGFEGPSQSRGFDQHPFLGDEANAAVYPLPDAVFRGMVQARAILVLSNGSCQDFERAVRFVDPDATVTDNRDMTITITTARQDLLELADRIGVLPRTAGVSIVWM